MESEEKRNQMPLLPIQISHIFYHKKWHKLIVTLNYHSKETE